MSAKYGYTRRDSDHKEAEETESELHRRAPEYRGYSRQDLKRVVTLLHKSTEPEQHTVQYCIDNGYREVEADVWAGNWHHGHPEYQKMLEQIPESLRRFVNTQQQMAAKVQAANANAAAANNQVSSSSIANNGNGGGADDIDGANNSGRSMNLSSAGGVSARSLATDTDFTVSSDDLLGPKSDQMVNVCGTDEPMTIAEATEDLKRALEVLKKANDTDEPWQHPRELLDATAGALDEAALAVRADRSPDPAARAEIDDLSKQVKAARQTLIEASAKGTVDITAIQEYSTGVKERNGTPLIVWASQTGTSRKFAAELRKRLSGSDGEQAVDAINMKKLTLKDVASRKRVYFITSTFGLGRPPRYAEFFFATLQLQQHSADHNKSTASRPLEGVQVAVAALGNSKFGDFAAFGFALAQELQTLGARPIMPVFTVNALHGRVDQRADFRQWQEEVLQLEGRTARSGGKDTPSAGSTGNSCCIIL